MKGFFKKVRKVPWVLGQRLTKKPTHPQSVISDLFIWRCSQDWNTYFELLDIASLFGDNGKHQVDIIFFDENGNEFHRKLVELSGLSRQVLDISDSLKGIDELPNCYGTFAVFHQKTPKGILETESFIAERGYVSYQYKGAPLRSYIHGNLDAIDDDLALLSSSSFLNRKYNLQYLLNPKRSYEMALVNISPSNKKVKFEISSFVGDIHIEKNVILKSKQVIVLPVKNFKKYSRLIIQSKIVMARPIVFCFDEDKIDVLHG